jgi:hypothetical protein
MAIPRDGKPMLRRLRVIETVTGPITQELRYITSAQGWVMYRVKGAAPAVMSRHEWDKLERRP